MSTTQLPPLTGRVHELKTDPDAFDAVAAGQKTHEIRKDDRGFAVGDQLLLRRTRYTGAQMHMRPEHCPLEYTGAQELRIVSHIQHGYGLSDGWVILSFAAPAALASVEGEPSQAVYQLQKADGSWIDQAKGSYDYNVRHGASTVRVLFLRPQPAQADAAQGGRVPAIKLDHLIPNAMRRYFRVCSSGGLPKKTIDKVMVYVEEAERLNYFKLAIAEAMLTASPEPAAAGQEPWGHLKRYGYAPGNYMSRCSTCDQVVSGLDKRAIRCKPCAEQLHTDPPASQEQAQQPTCTTCAGTGVVDDGEIESEGGASFENGPIKCVKDCPTCSKTVALSAAQQPAQAEAGTVGDECAATGASHSFGAHGPNGARQCQYCGEPQFEQEAGHVGDTRFEGWLGCHEPDRTDGRSMRYTKKDMRCAYWAGYSERAALQSAQAVGEDSKRLDWLLLRVSGQEFRRIGVFYSGNARRADIDAALANNQGGKA
jgi:hypothetical protein